MKRKQIRQKGDGASTTWHFLNETRVNAHRHKLPERQRQAALNQEYELRRLGWRGSHPEGTPWEYHRAMIKIAREIGA